MFCSNPARAILQYFLLCSLSSWEEELTCLKKSKTEDKNCQTQVCSAVIQTLVDEECKQVSECDTQGPGVIRVRKGEVEGGGKTHQDKSETDNTEYY